MLKNISPLISHELLSVLYRMGHGDEIVLADAHFPGDSMNRCVIRADGLNVSDSLASILPLFELDQYVDDISAVKVLLENTAGIERVLDKTQKNDLNIDNERAGDLVAIAEGMVYLLLLA